jgi:hypothetical protein
MGNVKVSAEEAKNRYMQKMVIKNRMISLKGYLKDYIRSLTT